MENNKKRKSTGNKRENERRRIRGRRGKGLIDQKECGRKGFYLIWGIGMAFTEEIMKNLSWDVRSPSRDLNQGPPKYEEGMLVTYPGRYVE
jgi:hypothetical protein